jgi:hypothetical protein
VDPSAPTRAPAQATGAKRGCPLARGDVPGQSGISLPRAVGPTLRRVREALVGVSELVQSKSDRQPACNDSQGRMPSAAPSRGAQLTNRSSDRLTAWPCLSQCDRHAPALPRSHLVLPRYACSDMSMPRDNLPPMDSDQLTSRMASNCAHSCRWPKCTGTGSTHHQAHRCAFFPDVELDPHPCTLCGRPARLYPHGWRCDDCTRAVPTPDPELTAAALQRRELSTVYPSPLEYGRATS